MTNVLQDQRDAGADGVPLLRLGFRPFFLGASIFAVVVVVLWTAVYTFSLAVPVGSISVFQWHAHEMIYGYGLAVIAGFLLTAARNWTGVQTLHGTPLLCLFVLWAGARVAMLFGTAWLGAAALLDIVFLITLIVATAYPILCARQWRQTAVLGKLVLLGAGAACFYLGALGYMDRGVHWGLYGGLYIVIGLILTMGRRVIPFFIERGVGYPVTLFNTRVVDIASLVLFLGLFVVEVFMPGRPAGPALAAALFAVNAVRLYGWHTPGIWKKPLLWSLYLAFAFIVAGFLLLALSGITAVPKYVAIHAFAYGGIGLVTLSMMIRVALGHTGRDVHHPPRRTLYALIALTAGAVCRVVLPVMWPQHYLAWIAASQVLWILAFGVTVTILFPMLTTPRADGRPG